MAGEGAEPRECFVKGAGLCAAPAELRRRFGDVKVVFDTSHVVVALVLSWTVLHTIDAFGVTTVIAALFLGKFINVMNRLFAAKFQRTAFGRDRIACASQ